MGISVWQILIILLIVLLLFGAGRLPRVMSDMAKGIKSFKTGLRDDEDLPGAEPPRQVTAERTTEDESVARRDRTIEH